MGRGTAPAPEIQPHFLGQARHGHKLWYIYRTYSMIGGLSHS